MGVDLDEYRSEEQIVFFDKNAPMATQILFDLERESALNNYRLTIRNNTESGIPESDVDIYIFNETTGKEIYTVSNSQGQFSFMAAPDDKIIIFGRKSNRDLILYGYRINHLLQNKNSGDLSIYFNDTNYKNLISSQKDFIIRVENISGTNQLFYAKEKELVEIQNEKSFFNENEPFDISSTLFISNIFFDFDKYLLKEEAKVELEKIVSTMIKYPNIHLEILSFADKRGASEYNKRLSEKRSLAVKDFLIKNGVSPNRVITKGLGEKHQIKCKDESDCSEEKYQINRRSEYMLFNYSINKLVENK